MSDRTVHAKYLDIEEVVRYDRAGKWYIELASGKRKHIGVKRAAQRAIELREMGGVIFLGELGGRVFDRLVKA